MIVSHTRKIRTSTDMALLSSYPAHVHDELYMKSDEIQEGCIDQTFLGMRT